MEDARRFLSAAGGQKDARLGGYNKSNMDSLKALQNLSG